VLHPFRALGTLLSADRFVYLAALLAPLAFLPLLAARDLIGALPALAQNLFASDPILYHHRTQYQSFVLPFLIGAAIAGYGRLARRAPGQWPVAVLVLAAVLSLALASRTVNNLSLARWWPAPEQRAAYRVMAQVPAQATLSAQDPYVPHLSQRSRVFVFPVGIDAADHVLINTTSYPWRSLPGVTMERRGRAVIIAMPGGRERPYAVVAEAGPHVLLRSQLSGER
jgi:uncharacterized membrane protein